MENEQAGAGRPNPSRDTKFSGANRDKELSIFPIQLITSRIGNLTRLIHTLAIREDRTYILLKHHISLILVLRCPFVAIGVPCCSKAALVFIRKAAFSLTDTMLLAETQYAYQRGAQLYRF